MNANETALPYSREAETLILARVILALNREGTDESSLHKVLGLLQRLLVAAETDNRMGNTIEILNLRALVFKAMGNLSSAGETIGRALHLAREEGYLRLFIDEGEPMQHLLSEAAGPASTS